MYRSGPDKGTEVCYLRHDRYEDPLAFDILRTVHNDIFV